MNKKKVHDVVKSIVNQEDKYALTLVENKYRSKKIETLRRRILHEFQVDVVLSSIINGEYLEERRHVTRKGKVIRYLAKPQVKDIIAAIELYYRRFGKLAPKSQYINVDNQRTLKVEVVDAVNEAVVVDKLPPEPANPTPE